jgi:hypothetical protein
MITSSTERASAMRPRRTDLGPVSGVRLASAIGALVAMVTLLALPQDAAAKYGSPLVTHVATAGGRGGLYLTARPARPAEARPTHLEAAASGTRAGRTATPHGDRRGTTRLGSHSDLGNGVVLARPARSVPQIAVVRSGLVLAMRDARVASVSASRADEFQHAAGQAHRLRGPPSLLA